MDTLTACIFSSWSPRIGDPTAMGWITVAVYALASAISFVVAVQRPFPLKTRRTEVTFWLLTGLLLAALAVNKQLDLQTLLTSAGRCLAKDQGWYEDRRLVQFEFFLALAGTTVLGLMLAAYVLRSTLRRTVLPLAGLFLVTGFVLMRAISFHHFDRLLGYTIGAARMNWILELTGPLLIATSAIWLLMGIGAGHNRYERTI